jgi:Ca-activated chloride channel family protein
VPRFAIAAAAATGLVVTTAAQQQPVFRSGIDTVAIYANVFDRYGEIITDLARPDFKIFDDGRRQELTVFMNGQQPITAVVIVDTSASMTPLVHLARGAAEQFVIRLQPGDRARVGSVNDRFDLSPEFTGNRDQLLRTIRDDLRIGQTTQLWDAVDETMSALGTVGGRRVILLLTDGLDTQSRTRADALLARAQAEEVLIYAVQFRPRLRQPDVEVPLSQGLRAMFATDARRERFPTETLRRLAMQTGGGHFVLTERDDVNSTFTRVANELRQQYVLGFSPQTFDGKPHALNVLVSRPGMVVRARRSYVAPLRPGL